MIVFTVCYVRDVRTFWFRVEPSVELFHFRGKRNSYVYIPSIQNIFLRLIQSKVNFFLRIWEKSKTGSSFEVKVGRKIWSRAFVFVKINVYFEKDRLMFCRLISYMYLYVYVYFYLGVKTIIIIYLFQKFSM